ncbi:MAG: AMP-dependent synthetase [Phenylobacterium sp.]|uniref:AMP-binding protein n=1 Tax=Phenylobacterium sp. TaxID=1871053 RepID=UPI0025F3ADC4|nr:AMP-binding protein [Phenylobacterium sp.]MBA4011945.1 AMP-dependent synthetase [Phenylobacterium sp.]
MGLTTRPDQTDMGAEPLSASDTIASSVPLMATFAERLEEYGSALAVATDAGERLSYQELAARADDFAKGLPPGRHLLLIEAANELAPLVAYIAALRHGHPVIMASADSGGQLQRTIEIFRPTIRYHRSGGRWVIQAGPPGPRDLHPDLAVLLSTSGSTGAAKLVRLDRGSIEANAAAIGTYLGLGPDERAITTLPIHYSYGLSVVNSHLAAGGAILLTGRSVVDESFWDFFTAEGATSLAGVPYTYELFERIGLRRRELPSLRTMTQAGGRLPPETAQVYAEWARGADVRFFVMYGQTEATARMAYVPPELLLENSSCIGVAIPGGAFHLIDEAGGVVSGAGVQGELVYRGANVMSGYALVEADLAKGRELSELRTGDLASRDAQGLYRIVGRKNRFSKLFGLRISFDEVEAHLRREGVSAIVTGDDELLAVGVVSTEPRVVAEGLAEAFSLPASVIEVVGYDELPTLSSGKMDYQALLATAHDAPARRTPARGRGGRAIEAAFHHAFPRAAITPADSFVSLGGDSLGYVRLSLDIEERLGSLPERWEETSIADLQALADKATTRSRGTFSLRGIESEVAIRAVAIMSVVISHASAWPVGGSAHVLLLLSGYNLSRYQGSRLNDGGGRSMLASFFQRIIAPYYAILCLYLISEKSFDVPSLLLVSNVFGRFGSFLEPYWFLEVLLQCMVILALLFAIGPVRRFAVRKPWEFGLALLAGALACRVIASLILPHEYLLERTPDSVFYLLAFGWCLHRATTTTRKLMLTVACLGIAALQAAGPPEIWEHFGYPSNVTHAIWFAGAACLIMWAPRIFLPNVLHGLIGLIAAASFYIYLTHGVPVHAFLHVAHIHNVPLILAVSLVLGVAAYKVSEIVSERLARSHFGRGREVVQ